MPDIAHLAARVSVEGLGEATRGLDTFGNKIEGVAAGLTRMVGTAAIAGVAGLTAGLGASVKAASDFETAISGTMAVGGRAAQEMRGELEKLALQLGADTSFSAKEAADGIQELVKAGVSMSNVMGGAAKASLDLAAAGGVSVADAATIASNAMNAFNIAGADMGKVADTIAGAANASAIDVGQFKQALQQSGAVAATVGFSFDDLAQAIAVMGQAGVVGSDAGTSIKTMLLALQPQTDKQAKLFKELGLITKDGANQFFDASGKVKSMAEVAGVLQNATKGMSEQQRIATLQTLFGTDAMRAAAIMSKAGAEGFRDMASAMGEVTAAEVAEKRLDNLAGSIEKFKGSLSTAAITIGRGFIPPIRKVVDAGTATLNAWMPTITAFSEKLPAATERATARVQALAATLATMAGGVLPVARSAVIRLLTSVADLMGMDPGEYAGVWQFAGGVIGTAAYIGKTAIFDLAQTVGRLIGLELDDYAYGWDTVGGVIRRVADIAIPAIAAIGAVFVAQFQGNLRFLTTYVLPAFHDVAVVTFSFLRDQAPNLALIGGTLRTILGESILWVAQVAWPALMWIARQSIDWFTAVVLPLLPGLAAQFRDVLGGALMWLASTGWPLMLGAATAFIAWVMGPGAAGFQVLWSWLSEKVGQALDWFRSEGWPMFTSVGQTVADWIKGQLIPWLTTAWQWFSDKLWSALSWFIDYGWPELKLAGQRVVNWIMTALIPWLTTAWEWFSDKLWSAISWFIDYGWPTLKATGQVVVDWIMTSLVPWLETAWKWLSDKLWSAVSWFIDYGWPKLKEAGDTVSTMLGGMWMWLGQLWTSMERRGVFDELAGFWDALKRIGGEFLQNVLGPMPGAFNDTSDSADETAIIFRDIVGVTRSVIQWMEMLGRWLDFAAAGWRALGLALHYYLRVAGRAAGLNIDVPEWRMPEVPRPWDQAPGAPPPTPRPPRSGGGGGGGGGGAPPAPPTPPPADPGGNAAHHPLVTSAEARSYWTSAGTHGGHPAADIFAPTGTPIFAPFDGTMEAHRFPFGGNAAFLDVENSPWWAYFAHGAVPFRNGHVRAGEQVGQVGDTGNATGNPHLHFALSKAGGRELFDRLNGSGDFMGDSSWWRVGGGEQPTERTLPRNFQEMLAMVTPSATRNGLPAVVMAALAANESGYGDRISELARKYFNWGGVKGSGPAGQTPPMWTWEDWNKNGREDPGEQIQERFAAYHSDQEYWDTWARQFSTGRYAAAKAAYDSSGRPIDYLQGLFNAGYATDANWVSQVRSIGGFKAGGIFPARPGGTLGIIGEGGQDEAVLPLPHDWRRRGAGLGPMQTIRLEVAIRGQVAEEIYVEGRDLAVRHGRILPTPV